MQRSVFPGNQLTVVPDDAVEAVVGLVHACLLKTPGRRSCPRYPCWMLERRGAFASQANTRYVPPLRERGCAAGATASERSLRVRSFRRDVLFDNNQTEICQHG